MKLPRGNEVILGFWCEGCRTHHYADERWTFNGDFEKPTFTPSLLVRYGKVVCHSFVTDGQIRYLSDCTHNLAGQILELEDIERS